MIKFKDLIDLQSKIQDDFGTGYILFCNRDTASRYLTKLIPEFQLKEDWFDIKHGHIGWYNNNEVWISEHIPNKTIYWSMYKQIQKFFEETYNEETDI